VERKKFALIFFVFCFAFPVFGQDLNIDTNNSIDTNIVYNSVVDYSQQDQEEDGLLSWLNEQHTFELQTGQSFSVNNFVLVVIFAIIAFKYLWKMV